MIFRRTKLVFNILILFFTAVTIFHCYSAIDTLINARPSIYKKYMITDTEKIILSRVNMDDSPIILYDDLDKWHSIYSVYQNDQLIFRCKYPNDDEQKVIDLVLKAQNQKVSIFLFSFLICIAIRIFISYMAKGLNRNDKERNA